jgi:DNA transposition AAA+ family ATPase
VTDHELLCHACKATSQRKVAKLLGVTQPAINSVLNGNYKADPRHIYALAREILGPIYDAPPAWVNELWAQDLRKEASDRTQAYLAKKMKVSTATINQLCKGTYKGNIARMERLFRGTRNECLECPVYRGPMHMHVCLTSQAEKPGRGSMYDGCRGIGKYAERGVCPHFLGPKSNKEKKA